MKRKQALEAYSALMGVSLNKMTEAMTDAVLADTLALAAIREQVAQVEKELRRRTIETISQERLAEYDNLVTKMEALNGQHKAAMQAVINDNFADVVKAQKAFIKALNKWLEKDVTIELERMERKEFIKAMKESEQTITPADLDILSPLFADYKAISAELDASEIDCLLED
jgi:hypothetical protein